MKVEFLGKEYEINSLSSFVAGVWAARFYQQYGIPISYQADMVRRILDNPNRKKKK